MRGSLQSRQDHQICFPTRWCLSKLTESQCKHVFFLTEDWFPSISRSMANIVIDSTSNELTLGGGTWKVSSTGRWFGGSSIYPAFAADPDTGDTGQYGTLNMPFRGEYLVYDTNNQYDIIPPCRDFHSFSWKHTAASSFSMGSCLPRWRHSI